MKNYTTFLSIILVIVLFCLSFYCTYQEQKWLKEVAIKTNGSIEREPVGEFYNTDSHGRPTSSTVQFHYYVRTGEGKRIDYRMPY